MSDGSVVRADPGSRLRVDDPKSDGARVLIERGRAAVSVSHRAGSSWSFLGGPFEVRRRERQGEGFEQSLLRQPPPDPIGGQGLRCVHLIAHTEGPQVGGNPVVAVDPGHFFDQVDLRLDIGPPAGNFDRESGVGGRLSSSGGTGIVVGNTDRHDLLMDLLSTDVKVFPDEVVETSGFDSGSMYPPGILIGYVSASSEQPGSLHRTINVRPAVDFSSLEFVLIVTNSASSSPSPSG